MNSVRNIIPLRASQNPFRIYADDGPHASPSANAAARAPGESPPDGTDSGTDFDDYDDRVGGGGSSGGAPNAQRRSISESLDSTSRRVQLLPIAATFVVTSGLALLTHARDTILGNLTEPVKFLAIIGSMFSGSIGIVEWLKGSSPQDQYTTDAIDSF